MTVTAAGLKDVTVSSAEVTIQVVHVANKPMTIAVYNQLPYRGNVPEGARLVGWINRCHQKCNHRDINIIEHRHVLVVESEEPVLALATDRGLALEYEASALRTEAAEGDYYRLKQRSKQWGWHPYLDLEEMKTEATAQADILEMQARPQHLWWSTHIAPLPQLYVAR
jgi:hypothetical protein